MNLEMAFDDKMKPVNDQPDQKSCGKKPKGLHLLSSTWWCPAAVTLAILCLVLSVTLIVQQTRLLQVSDLLKKYQANLTQQDHILEGQMSAQKKAENASQESKRELKEQIDTLTWKLNEKSKEQEKLLQQNQNLQEALQRAANSSELRLTSNFPFHLPILDGITSEESQPPMAMGERLSFEFSIL